VVLAKLIFGGVLGRGDHDRGWRKGGIAPHASNLKGPERWRHWREFWEQEGRQAFERYLERRGKEKSGEASQETL